MARTAYRFFLDKGLIDYQVAGIVGNLDWEYKDDPAKTEKGGCRTCGMGIAQWTGGRWDKDRKDNVTWYASQSHASRWDLKTQLNFIWYELTSFNNSEKKPYYGLAALRSAQNVRLTPPLACSRRSTSGARRPSVTKAPGSPMRSQTSRRSDTTPGETTIRTRSLGAGVVRGPDGMIW